MSRVAAVTLYSCPKLKEVEGLCDFKERREKGITRNEAEELVTKLKGNLTQSLQQKIGDVHLRGFQSLQTRYVGLSMTC